MSELHDLFADLPEDLQRGIADLGWHTPMPVQAKAIPLMREGRDLIVQARTGSGKTGAFGVPIIEAIDTESREVQALIMVPTRELANQVSEELIALGRHTGVHCLAVYGGVGYGPQVEALERGVHVVVGTPGRMLDHLGAKRMHLDEVEILVLDEADEMLSLGFWPDMRQIREYLPTDRRSYLFSATIPEKVRSLSRFFLKDAEFVTLSEGQVGPQEIEHFFYLCSAQDKERLLAQVLEYEDPESAIIFCNTKSDVRFVTAFLKRRGLDADQISGDLTQTARDQAMGKIKAGDLRFLVATDVAARGIDISDLSHVISYSTPLSPEVYVHRTGRTGRAGKSGVAISLVSGLDIGNFRSMQHVNQIKVNERKAPTEKDLQKRVLDRLAVKVEHEMRSLSESDRRERIDRLIPVVEGLMDTKEGRRDLAAVCAAYLTDHRPETTVKADEVKAQEPRAPKTDDEARADREPRPRRGRRDGGRSAGGGGRGRR